MYHYKRKRKVKLNLLYIILMQINAEEKSEQQQEQHKDMINVHNIPQTHPQYEQQQMNQMPKKIKPVWCINNTHQLIYVKHLYKKSKCCNFPAFRATSHSFQVQRLILLLKLGRSGTCKHLSCWLQEGIQYFEGILFSRSTWT